MAKTSRKSPSYEGGIPPRPTTVRLLRDFVATYLEITLADTPVVPGHAAPLDYLAHTFFEGDPPPTFASKGLLTEVVELPPSGEQDQAQACEAVQGLPIHLPQIAPPVAPPAPPIVDCVVWANRGGGKTMLGAIATFLDLLYKPGIQVRILGGSMEQAQRMHEHLRGFFAKEPFGGLVKGKIIDRRIALTNSSAVELLAQSQTSVRGTRVQKLRCDEVELFDRDVWEAAQLVTRSRSCGGVPVRGAIECLSTMHVPSGIMHGLVSQALEGRRRLFKWGVVDTLEKCPSSRPCESCTLLPECGSRARRTPEDPGGHISIDDAIQMKSRVTLATWESEMLCTRPSRTAAVIPEFDPARHVVDSVASAEGGVWVGGMDFGFRSPTVVLWGLLDAQGVLWIDQERSVSDMVIQSHIDDMIGPHRPKLSWIAVDPAGTQVNLHSGTSTIALLSAAGLKVRYQTAGVLEGILRVRARLSPADGSRPRLFVHRRCVTLIESMSCYSYGDDPESVTPEKGKGYDHAVDALRYLVQSLDRPSQTRVASYTD